MTTLSIKQVSFNEPVKNDQAPSQQELIEKLMALIVLLQKIQGILNGNTFEDITRIGKQSQSMSVLAKAELDATNKAGQDVIDKLDAIAHASFWQKLFGYLAGALSIVVGALLALSGNPLGGVLIAVGALSLAETVNPGTLDKAISSICGDNLALKSFMKGYVIALTTAASGLAGGPIGAFMMFGAAWSAANPLKDGVSDDDAWKINLGVSAATIVASLGYSYLSAPEEAASLAAEGAGAVAGGGAGAVAGAGAIVGEAGVAGGAAGASRAASSLSLLAKLKKALENGLKALLIATTTAAYVGQDSSSIAVGALNMELAQAQKDFGDIKAQSQTTQQLQEVLDSIVKNAESFLHSLLQTFEANNSTISKVFVDQTKFAQMLAKAV